MEQTHRFLTKLAAGDRLEAGTDGALGGAETATILRLSTTAKRRRAPVQKSGVANKSPMMLLMIWKY